MKLAVIAITKNGSALARRIREADPKGVDLYIPGRFMRPGWEGAKPLKDNLEDEVARLFRKYKAVAFIMAAGIVVRLIAPLIKGKLEDPAVLVLDEKGQYVVSLLSGHAGGANDLAHKVAGMTGGRAVITTASDVQGIPAVDTLAGKLDCAVEDLKQAKKVTAAMVNGEAVAVCSYEGRDKLKSAFNKLPDNLKFYAGVDNIACSGEVAAIIISPYLLPRKDLGVPGAVAVLRPRVLVVGVGCNRGTSAGEIDGLFESVFREHGLSPLSVRNIATIEDKKDEAGLNGFAKRRRLKVEYISKEDLLKAATPSGPSEKVFGNMGVYGVCEPAALLSAGAKKLLVAKVKSKNVTLAVAEAGLS